MSVFEYILYCLLVPRHYNTVRLCNAFRIEFVPKIPCSLKVGFLNGFYFLLSLLLSLTVSHLAFGVSVPFLTMIHPQTLEEEVGFSDGPQIMEQPI